MPDKSRYNWASVECGHSNDFDSDTVQVFNSISLQIWDMKMRNIMQKTQFISVEEYEYQIPKEKCGKVGFSAFFTLLSQ